MFYRPARHTCGIRLYMNPPACVCLPQNDGVMVEADSILLALNSLTSEESEVPAMSYYCQIESAHAMNVAPCILGVVELQQLQDRSK